LHYHNFFGVTTDWFLFGDNQKEESPSVAPLAKDKKITRYFQSISKLWIEGDRDKKGWIITQLERAFPEVAEEINKGDDESGGTNTNSSQ
jgi:hypothetical protein